MRDVIFVLNGNPVCLSDIDSNAELFFTAI